MRNAMARHPSNRPTSRASAGSRQADSKQASSPAKPAIDEPPSENFAPEILRSRLQRTGASSDVQIHEQIATRAYELAAQRGFLPGEELADWLQAERELTRQTTR
jgi:hypothetical protein